MTFPYSDYWVDCFAWLLLICLMILMIYVPYLVDFLRCGKWREGRSKIWAEFLFHTGISVTLFWIHLSILLHGGLYLLSEQETDAVPLTGLVEEIEGVDRDHIPNRRLEYDYEEWSGWILTIDGTECVTMRKGDIAVGDRVTVKYLPQSGYVLYIEELEEGKS